MNRSLGQIALFVAFVVAVMGALHFYLWARLVRDTQLPPPYRALGTALLVTLALLVPASFFLARSRQLAWKPLLFAIYGWLGLLMLLFLCLVAADVAKLVLLVVRRATGAPPLEPARRLFFARLFAGAATTGGLGLGLAALRGGLRPPTLTNVDVAIDGLPRALDGLTIVHLSDLHVGPTIGRAWLEEVVRRTNELRPDVVAITGDLVDGRVATLRHAVAPLASLRAKHGVFFCTGNHEYYSGADEWCEELGRLGVRVLRNERVTLGDEKTERLDLAGVDDYHARPDLERALSGRDSGRPCVLLAHQPIAVLEAAARGVSLQLSGHTHGGQIWPWSYLVRLQQPFVAGLCREGRTQLYVSKGTGYWGPPMRLGADAEIAHITLHAA